MDSEIKLVKERAQNMEDTSYSQIVRIKEKQKPEKKRKIASFIAIIFSIAVIYFSTVNVNFIWFSLLLVPILIFIRGQNTEGELDKSFIAFLGYNLKEWGKFFALAVVFVIGCLLSQIIGPLGLLITIVSCYICMRIFNFFRVNKELKDYLQNKRSIGEN